MRISQNRTVQEYNRYRLQGRRLEMTFRPSLYSHRTMLLTKPSLAFSKKETFQSLTDP